MEKNEGERREDERGRECIGLGQIRSSSSSLFHFSLFSSLPSSLLLLLFLFYLPFSFTPLPSSLFLFSSSPPRHILLLLPLSSPLLSSLLSSAVLHRAEVYIFIHLLSSLLLRCEFEDVVLDQEGPGVGIHMFIIIVNTIDISAPVAHRGQAPVPPSFSLFNKSIRERLWACWGTTSSHPQCRLVQPSPTASSPELFEAKLCSSIKLSDLLKATSSYYTTFIITTTQLLTRSPTHLLTHSLTYNPIP